MSTETVEIKCDVAIGNKEKFHKAATSCQAAIESLKVFGQALADLDLIPVEVNPVEVNPIVPSDSSHQAPR